MYFQFRMPSSLHSFANAVEVAFLTCFSNMVPAEHGMGYCTVNCFSRFSCEGVRFSVCFPFNKCSLEIKLLKLNYPVRLLGFVRGYRLKVMQVLVIWSDFNSVLGPANVVGPFIEC